MNNDLKSEIQELIDDLSSMSLRSEEQSDEEDEVTVACYLQGISDAYFSASTMLLSKLGKYLDEI